MKTVRIVLASILVVFIMLAALVWFLPARLALFLAGPPHELQLEQVHGLAWQGYADHAYTAAGIDLGRVSWSLSRRALLGDVWLDVHTAQPKLQFSGQLHRLSATEVDWRQVTLHADAALLGPQRWLKQGQPGGWLDVHIGQAHLQGNWPMQLDATAQWRNAVLGEPYGQVHLGTLTLQINALNGIVQGMMSDDGRGPLRMSGRLSVSPLGWNVTASLTPRRDDAALRQWLRSFDEPVLGGTLYLHYRGGLATFTSPTE